jgi:hypothetical protein
MARSVTRRPLPALVSLLALLLLTALVWWRVLHRGDGKHVVGAVCPTPTVVAILPAPASVTVQVLNATARSGIAAKARTTLIGDGFNIPTLAANDKRKVKVPGTAEIRYGPKGKQGASLLRYYFPGAKMVVTTSTKPTVVVSLGSRYRTVASATAVQTALKAAKIALAVPSGSPAPSQSPTC